VERGTYQNISGTLEYRTTTGIPVIEPPAIWYIENSQLLGEHKAEKELPSPSERLKKTKHARLY